MKKIISALLVLIIGLLFIKFAVKHAVNYGVVWDSRTNPHFGTQVTLLNGTTIQGALSRSWDQSWEIRQEDGGIVTFTDFNELKLPGFQGEELRLIDHWRRYLPVLMLFSVFYGLLLLLLCLWIRSGLLKSRA